VKVRYHFEDLEIDGIILKLILEPLGTRVLNEFNWLRKGSNDKLLQTLQ